MSSCLPGEGFTSMSTNNKLPIDECCVVCKVRRGHQSSPSKVLLFLVPTIPTSIGLFRILMGFTSHLEAEIVAVVPSTSHQLPPEGRLALSPSVSWRITQMSSFWPRHIFALSVPRPYQCLLVNTYIFGNRPRHTTRQGAGGGDLL